MRELENTIEHAVAMATGERILPQDLPPRIGGGVAGMGAGPAEVGAGDGSGGEPGPLREAVARAQEAVERRLIEQALAATGGNRTEAAKRLGVSRRTLFTKVRDLRIDAGSGGEAEG